MSSSPYDQAISGGLKFKGSNSSKQAYQKHSISQTNPESHKKTSTEIAFEEIQKKKANIPLQF